MVAMVVGCEEVKATKEQSTSFMLVSDAVAPWRRRVTSYPPPSHADGVGVSLPFALQPKRHTKNRHSEHIVRGYLDLRVHQSTPKQIFRQRNKRISMHRTHSSHCLLAPAAFCGTNTLPVQRVSSIFNLSHTITAIGGVFGLRSCSSTRVLTTLMASCVNLEW